MRSQEKTRKALPKSSILGTSGRVNRSKAAVSHTVKPANRPTLQAPFTRSSQQGQITSTPTSISENSDASDVAGLSSRTSNLDYVDRSCSASSDYEEDEDEQSDSAWEHSEASSGTEPTTCTKAPVAKRIKLSQLPKKKVQPLSKDDLEGELESRVEVELDAQPESAAELESQALPRPEVKPAPDKQIKIKDAWNFKNGVNKKLPPISDIVEIFDDLSKKAMDLGLDRAIQQLGSRKLKLATMCSGTESPLLALKLVSESKYNYLRIEDIEVTHEN